MTNAERIAQARAKINEAKAKAGQTPDAQPVDMADALGRVADSAEEFFVGDNSFFNRFQAARLERKAKRLGL